MTNQELRSEVLFTNRMFLWLGLTAGTVIGSMVRWWIALIYLVGMLLLIVGLAMRDIWRERGEDA